MSLAAASFEYALMMRTERMLNGDHRAAIQPESELDDNIDFDSRAEAELLARMHRRLGESRSYLKRTTSSGRNAVCIYRVPPSLRGVGPEMVSIGPYHRGRGVGADNIAPEIVSIGPYHHGRDRVLEFDNYKWSFLDYVLSFTRKKGIDLDRIMTSMADLETSARRCYSEPTQISSQDFVEMMILDSCFILGYMLQIYKEHDPILTMPWSIPIVTRDLLKLENQIPFFVLEMVYDLMKTTINGDSLELLALKFFNLALPRRDQDILKRLSVTAKPKHLLDLVHSSYLPSTVNQPPVTYTPTYSHQSIQCVRQLQKSGIKIRPVKTNSFLEINFKKATLHIPPIAINHYTITLFINCIALEQCTQHIRTHFSAYVAFMCCLINSTRDVTFLRRDGIIASFFRDDQQIVCLFHKLGEKLGENTALYIRDGYLSKQFREVESYYSSNWATLKRTYFPLLSCY